MSANELLTLVGLAWPRLVLYPGGAAIGALLWMRLRRRALDTAAEHAGGRSQSLQVDHAAWLPALSCVVLPWLGLALLPLPLATALGRTTDLVMVLALLEWPRVLAIANELRDRDAARQRAGVGRLVAALNSYPPLMLATLALAQPAGSLDLAALARPPSSMQALHWAGAIGWALALPVVLGLGPFRTPTPPTAPTCLPNLLVQLGLGLRGCGLAAIALLPWLAPFGALDRDAAYAPPTWLAILGAPLVLGALLWGYDRFSAGQSARRWAWAYLALDGALLLALLAAAYLALPGRFTA